MMKPEPSELMLARRAVRFAGHRALAAAVLEELVEELLERRARRQIGHVGRAASIDLLRRRDIDHRVDHLLGDVGDVVGTARQRRCADQGEQHHDGAAASVT